MIELKEPPYWYCASLYGGIRLTTKLINDLCSQFGFKASNWDYTRGTVTITKGTEMKRITLFNAINHVEYPNKPKLYADMATAKSLNDGIPYYIGSPTFGYEGAQVPIAGTLSKFSRINEETGEIDKSRITESFWITCTASRYQRGRTYRRCSLSDDGVIYQTYSDRLAFLTIEAALDYSNTGITKPYKG